MNSITKHVRLAHALTLTVPAKHSWTARCSCGAEASTHSKKEALAEFRSHRQRVQEQLDRPINVGDGGVIKGARHE